MFRFRLALLLVADSAIKAATILPVANYHSRTRSIRFPDRAHSPGFSCSLTGTLGFVAYPEQFEWLQRRIAFWSGDPAAIRSVLLSVPIGSDAVVHKDVVRRRSAQLGESLDVVSPQIFGVLQELQLVSLYMNRLAARARTNPAFSNRFRDIAYAMAASRVAS